MFYQNNADYIFGGVTIVSGVLGTLAGGYALDRLTSTIPNAFKVNYPLLTLDMMRQTLTPSLLYQMIMITSLAQYKLPPVTISCSGNPCDLEVLNDASRWPITFGEARKCRAFSSLMDSPCQLSFYAGPSPV